MSKEEAMIAWRSKALTVLDLEKMFSFLSSSKNVFKYDVLNEF